MCYWVHPAVTVTFFTQTVLCKEIERASGRDFFFPPCSSPPPPLLLILLLIFFHSMNKKIPASLFSHLSASCLWRRGRNMYLLDIQTLFGNRGKTGENADSNLDSGCWLLVQPLDYLYWLKCPCFFLPLSLSLLFFLHLPPFLSFLPG